MFYAVSTAGLIFFTTYYCPSGSGLAVGEGFFFGSRPAFFSAVESIHSIWPLLLRNSSAAHFSMASKTSASTRKAKFFFIRFGYW